MDGLNIPGMPAGVVDQSRALAWAVEALATTEMDDPFERAVAELLRAAYERRLDEIAAAAHDSVSGEIFRAAQA
jgi:hypothetical protein